VLLLALALVRGLIYAAVIPPWQAPDEFEHFEYSWLIARLGHRPTPEDLSPQFERELLGSLYEWRIGEFSELALPEQVPDRMRNTRVVQSERFSLAYVWTALFIQPFQHQDLAFQLYAARLSSIVLNLTVVWLAWRILKLLLPQQPDLTTATTAFVTFLPQHTFINASVGEGPLAELAACVVLYGWLRAFLGRPGWLRNALAIMGGTMVGLWTKKTTVFLLPLDALLGILFLVRHSKAIHERRKLLYLALGLTAIALLVAGWWTPAGRSAKDAFLKWWSDPQVYAQNDETSVDRTLWQAFDSFWAQFGWMNVRVGPAWYLAVYILAGAALEGWLLPRFGRSVDETGKRILATALSLATTCWLAFVLFTPNGLSFSQGRYLFPVVVPAGFFLVAGWARWPPKRGQRYVAPGAVAVMVVLDASALCLGVWPFFYGN
jgi:hypothetical protein